MSRPVVRCLALAASIAALLILGSHPATAADCSFDDCPEVGLDGGAANTLLSGQEAASIVGASPAEAADYIYRTRPQCVVAADATGNCSPATIRTCPQQPGRVIDYYFVERRAVIRPDGTAVIPVPPGRQPGAQIGAWTIVREGCLDITPLNPPPSPAEVFSYFQRLPLPTLTTEHQPPGNGLTGLPVIFYTDSPTTQTFTVDIRGFSVVIQAVATQYTWHTGDPRTPVVTSTEPGQAYPNQTIEHPYKSGTYTAYLTVTWGATFTVNGGAPANVAGTTTTDGPAVTFDVLQARAVLTNPYD
jgi:hypothetical protein